MAAILSTFTTIGMILAVLMLALDYIRKEYKDKNTKIIMFSFGIFVFAIALILSYQLFTDKASSSSWAIRTMDYVNGFKAWKSSPIFGVGYGDFEKANKVAGIMKQGYSNSVFAILSQGGLLLFTVYIIPFILGIKYSFVTGNKEITFFILIVLLEFILTLFPYTFLLLFLLAFFSALGLTSLQLKHIIPRNRI